MTATLQKLDDEPILIVTYEGFLSLQTVEDANIKIVRAMQESPVTLYGIIDLRHATTRLPEVLRILAHQSLGKMGTLSDSDSYVVLVGTSFFIRLFQKLMHERTFGGVTLAVYNTMDDALHAVRQRIQRDNQQNA